MSGQGKTKRKTRKWSGWRCGCVHCIGDSRIWHAFKSRAKLGTREARRLFRGQM